MWYGILFHKGNTDTKASKCFKRGECSGLNLSARPTIPKYDLTK